MQRNKPIKIVTNGRFSTALKNAVEARGLSLTEVAQAVDSTYEHMRKLIGGRAYPSRNMLRRLCAVFNADYDDWEELYERDKFQEEFGGKIPKCLIVSDEVKRFGRLLGKLSPEQRATALAVARTLLNLQTKKRN